MISTSEAYSEKIKMTEQKLEQKLKVFNLRDMPQEVQDVFLAEYFNVNYLRGKVPADSPRRIFRGPQIELLIRGPVDSGHPGWRATPWYESQGIKSMDDAFVIQVDVDYLIDYVKKNFNWENP